MKKITFHFFETTTHLSRVCLSFLVLFIVSFTNGCQSLQSLELTPDSILPVLTPTFETQEIPSSNVASPTQSQGSGKQVTSPVFNTQEVPSSKVISPTPSQDPVVALIPTGTPISEDPRIIPCTNKDQPDALAPSQDRTGTLLFRTADNKIIALNPATLEERTILSVQENIDAFGGIGLESRWIALIRFQRPHSILLLSADGEVIIQDQISLPLLTDFEVWWNPGNWISYDTVQMSFGYRDTASAESKGDHVLLDPFHGLWHTELMDSLVDNYKREYYSGVAFSPDLTRALYIQGKDKSPNLVLWDTDRQVVLWSKEWYGGPPFKQSGELNPSAWTSDNSRIAFLYKSVAYPLKSNQNETTMIYILDKDGIEIGTILGNLASNRAASARGLIWSPNGRYLAFTMPSEESLFVTSIYIYDYKKQEVGLLCQLDEEDVPTHRLISNKFVWSPDSRYLIYHIGSNFPHEPGLIVMQNLFTGKVRKIDLESKFPFLIGWSSVSQWTQVVEEIVFPPITELEE